MVSEEHRLGLYVAIPVYFAFLAGATYWAYKRMERMEHDGISDKVRTRSLHIIVALSAFGSVRSTVVFILAVGLVIVLSFRHSYHAFIH